ncbi:DNA modification methylase [Chryseobacterium sp.]|uniref:DNA modification methylase n=1 Tax=Chryseobacterium sp. TaxID=1871047 RepID=UPI0024E1C7A5|nr:DNA modification methylase [Chryseobacterium sp.]
MNKQILQTLENIKFKKRLEKIKFELMEQHPFHLETYDVIPEDYLSNSLDRSGDEPIYPPVLVVNNDRYFIISGTGRIDHMIRKGLKECSCYIIEDGSEDQIIDLVIDLNKSRVKNGVVLRKEFEHFMRKYLPKKGTTGYNRYKLIGKEVNLCEERVKKIVAVIEQLQITEFMYLVDKVFSNQYSLNQLRKFCSLIKEVKLSKEVIDKLFENNCDFDLIKKVHDRIDLENDEEFKALLPSLQSAKQINEINSAIDQLTTTKDYIEKFNKGKVPVNILTDKYQSENSIIYNNDSRLQTIPEKLIGNVRVIIGSPEYGYDTKRPGRNWSDNDQELRQMTSKEFAKYIASIYKRFVKYLAPDGSIYIVVYDYKNKDGSYSLFPEHLAIEMKEIGLHLTGRKKWVKNNPLRRQYSYKDSVEAYEDIYRFSLSPNEFYLNPYMFMKDEVETIFKRTSGCTNHGNKKTGIKGGKYFQSNLKKVVNVLDKGYCEDIIRCNVGNPGDFFRQAQEVENRHSSTSPIELTATLVLESTQPGDTVLDIWNGVGNTMLSSLLLGRKYVGIEIEEKYFKQTVEKVQEVEKFIEDHDIMNINLSKKIA